jgi:hypothetical protein
MTKVSRRPATRESASLTWGVIRMESEIESSGAMRTGRLVWLGGTFAKEAADH